MTLTAGEFAAIEKLIKSIETDNNLNGGLLSRDTIRASDELRLLMSRVNVQLTEDEIENPKL